MIHFVGAGAGAVDLITVRGAKHLSQATQVIYAGSLVNPELLDLCQEETTLLNSATMTLDQVISAMKGEEAKGGTTVRLHTGDPCLYGAIQEQMDALEEAGIAFDITAGVSSFSGAAAALKREYTLPSVSQTVIITRMAGRTPVPEKEALYELAKHGCTMVLFLSTGLLEEVQRDLLAGGVYTPETPAAIVYKATWKDEKVLPCTIATLQETAEQHNIKKTALITIGDFLASDYEKSLLYDPSFSHEFRQGDK